MQSRTAHGAHVPHPGLWSRVVRCQRSAVNHFLSVSVGTTHRALHGTDPPLTLEVFDAALDVLRIKQRAALSCAHAYREQI
jgi:hypothetical protein